MREFERNSRQRWNEIYGREVTSESTQEDMPMIADTFRRYNVRKLLDLGCGSGRYTAYLAKKGFATYGIDISDEAIRIARSRLEKEGLHAELRVGSIYRKLPYKDNFFDAIVCIQTLHHARIGDIQKAIDEMGRVLKPSGLAFVTVRKRIPRSNRLAFQDIAPRTYIPTEGRENGLVHYLFNKALLREAFDDFKVSDIWVDKKNYYCLLGELKSEID